MIKRVSILTLLGLVIGGVVGVLAAGFVEAVLWLNDLFYVSRQSRTLVSNPAWLTAMTIGIPTAGGLIVGLLSTMMPGNRFHGPSDALRTAQSLDATMPVKSGVLFTRGACVSAKNCAIKTTQREKQITR